MAERPGPGRTNPPGLHRVEEEDDLVPRRSMTMKGRPPSRRFKGSNEGASGCRPRRALRFRAPRSSQEVEEPLDVRAVELHLEELQHQGEVDDVLVVGVIAL